MSSFCRNAMKYLRARKRIICISAPIIIGAIYMVLCIAQLNQSIWFDESYSAYLTRFEYPKIWAFTASDVHPPLYYFVLKTWAHFFGHTEVAMRSLSVIFGAIAVLFAFLWIKYKYGATAAITASTLLAISPVFVRYGQEMRMYTMVLAIVFAATYVLQLAVDNQRKRWWIIYAILLSLGMWTHYFCAFAWIAHLVYLCRLYGKKIFQKKIVMCYVGAIVLYLPWIPSLIAQIGAVQNGFWIPDMSVHTVANYWTETLVYQSSGETTNWLLMLLIVATIIIVSLAIRFRSKMRLLLSIAVVPFLLLILLSMPPLSPIFIPRYVLYSMVAVALVSGVALVLYARSPYRHRSKKAIKRRVAYICLAIAVLVGSSICGLCSVYAKGNYNFETQIKTTSRDLFDAIAALDNGENLAIISASEWLYFDLAFYSTNEHSAYFLDETTNYKYGSLHPLKESEIGRIVDLDKFLSRRKAFWYITSPEENGSVNINFPREGWRVAENSIMSFDKNGESYAIVKMVKE